MVGIWLCSVTISFSNEHRNILKQDGALQNSTVCIDTNERRDSKNMMQLFFDSSSLFR